VEIVPAGMRHMHARASGIDRGRGAGEWQTGFLFDGQRIQFSAQHDGRARPVAQPRHQAGLADSRGHFVAQRAHARGQLRRGACFLEAQFRVLVQVFV